MSSISTCGWAGERSPCHEVARRVVAVHTEIERDLDSDHGHVPPDTCGGAPGVQAPPWPARIKILFIAVNDPAGRLAVDKEHRAIRKALRRRRDRVEIEPLLAARADELGEELRDQVPHIVHFAGHGTHGGALIFNDGNGALCHVSVDAFAALLRALRGDIRLVVLNACFSREQAQAMCQTTGLAIGMGRQITDDAAITFARALYGALADRRSVGDAFEIARAEMAIVGAPSEATVPELFVRDGLDASRVHLPRLAPHTERRPAGTGRLGRPGAAIALLVVFTLLAVLAVLLVTGAARCHPGGSDEFAIKIRFIDETRQPIKITGKARLESDAYTPTVLVDNADMVVFEQLPHRLDGSDASFTIESYAFRVASPARTYRLRANGIIYLELQAITTKVSGTVSFAGERLPGGQISLAGHDCSGSIRNGYFEIPCADVTLPVKAQVREPVLPGRRICMREFMLQSLTNNELVLGACPPLPPPAACPHSPQELIRREAEFVQRRDLGGVVDLFAPGATVHDAATGVRLPARDRYRAELAGHHFVAASHADVACEPPVNRTLRCTSSSTGKFEDGTGYANPPGSDHWVLEKLGSCWRVRSLAINAAGKPFPAEETAP